MEIMQDEGSNSNLHWKMIGYVNGLDFFRNIINDKILENREKTQQQEQAHVVQQNSTES